MKKFLFFLTLFLVFVSSVIAEDAKLYLFHSETCPHCRAEIEFLESIQDKYPTLVVEKFEVTTSRENAELFFNLSKACGVAVSGVPATFIGDDTIIGFDVPERKGKEIEDKIKSCVSEGCIDAMSKLGDESCEVEESSEMELPVFGNVDTSKISLPIFTLVIAGLDGINPCAIWVLCFLLTLLVYAKSRKRVLLIGGIFVLASGVVYFIFMTAWLNFFLFVGYVRFFMVLIALLAIFMGLVNIKDFFFFKKGISLTIPDKYKPKLFKEMRHLVKEKSLPAVILGTFILAFTANLVEIACTAGFPAIYTKVLTMQNMSTFGYYSYLVFYNLVYVVPLAVIVTIFAWTMGRYKFEEKEGRILKLVGGLIMLLLGLILLFRPELLAFG